MLPLSGVAQVLCLRGFFLRELQIHIIYNNP